MFVLKLNNLIDITITLVNRIFAAHPTLQTKFHNFDDVPLADLPSNAAFNAQVKLVADRFDSIVSHLNTPLKLGGELRYMAFSHKPRAVLRQEFLVIPFACLFFYQK